MKLDRNMPENNGRGKYALLLLRNINKPRDLSHYANYESRIREALQLLEEVGILDWGEAGTEAEFFLIRLKDEYSRPALLAYADAARKDDVEYADEVVTMAARSGDHSPWCKRPD